MLSTEKLLMSEVTPSVKIFPSCNPKVLNDLKQFVKHGDEYILCCSFHGNVTIEIGDGFELIKNISRCKALTIHSFQKVLKYIECKLWSKLDNYAQPRLLNKYGIISEIDNYWIVTAKSALSHINKLLPVGPNLL